MEFTLLWAAVTAVAFMWVGTRIWNEGLPDQAFDRLLGASAIGLAIGRIVEMTFQGTSPFTDPGALLVVRGGVHTGAAALAAAGFLVWSVRDDARRLDAVTPAVTLGLGGWHAGCLWTSSCLGTVSDLPWAWSLSGSDITRHPVELYAALALIAAAPLIARLPHRPWLKTGAAIFAICIVRLATEPLRVGLGDEMMWWYGSGALAGLALAIGSLRSQMAPAPT